MDEQAAAVRRARRLVVLAGSPRVLVGLIGVVLLIGATQAKAPLMDAAHTLVEGCFAAILVMTIGRESPRTWWYLALALSGVGVVLGALAIVSMTDDPGALSEGMGIARGVAGATMAGNTVSAVAMWHLGRRFAAHQQLRTIETPHLKADAIASTVVFGAMWVPRHARLADVIATLALVTVVLFLAWKARRHALQTADEQRRSD